jgi:hypothetical protein
MSFRFILAMSAVFGFGCGKTVNASIEDTDSLEEVCNELKKEWMHIEDNEGVHLLEVTNGNCVSFASEGSETGMPVLHQSSGLDGLPDNPGSPTNYASIVHKGEQSFFALNLRKLSKHTKIKSALETNGMITLIYGHYCESGDYFQTSKVLYKDFKKTCSIQGAAYLKKKSLEPFLRSDSNGVITGEIGSIAVGLKSGNANFVQVDIVVNGILISSLTRDDLEKKGIAESHEGELYIKVSAAYQFIPALSKPGAYAIIWSDYMHDGWRAAVFGKSSSGLEAVAKLDSLGRYYPRDKMRYDFNKQ